MQSTRSRTIALLFLSSALVHAAPADRTTSIQWGDCDFNVTAGITCGQLTVPLDYTDSQSNATLDLQLVKIPAARSPSRGSIIFNFGGPGNGGRQSLAGGSSEYLKYTGGYHDLISFDPRGTENTIRFSCRPTDGTVEPPLPPFTLLNASDTSLGRIWARSQVKVNKCLRNANVTGSLISTPFAARDIMQIVDALGEDGLLRFWGMSYGTVMGATVAAMFPDRVDKVLLDGVVNTEEYYHFDTGAGNDDIDKTFSGMIAGCVAAGKHKCALAGVNESMSAPELEEAIYRRLDVLKYQPIVLPNLLDTLEYTRVKMDIFQTLYRPKEYPMLAQAMAAVLANDIPTLEQIITQQKGGSATSTDESADDPTNGIRCADNDFRVSDPSQMIPTIRKYYARSRLAGDIIPATNLGDCWQWKITAKERYSGHFIEPNSLKTRNPLLVIGNSFDPSTPLTSARNVSAVFDGSVLLQQNGYGHCATAQSSKCTAQAVANYFVNGILPLPGTVCEVDDVLFQPTNSSAAVIDAPPKPRGLGFGRRWIV